VVVKCVAGETCIVLLHSINCLDRGVARHRRIRIARKRVSVVCIIRYVVCWGMSVRGGRLGMLVGFGVEEYLVGRDLRFTRINEHVRHDDLM
jgi:hypothetical protein